MTFQQLQWPPSSSAPWSISSARRSGCSRPSCPSLALSPKRRSNNPRLLSFNPPCARRGQGGFFYALGKFVPGLNGEGEGAENRQYLWTPYGLPMEYLWTPYGTTPPLHQRCTVVAALWARASQTGLP